MFPSVFCHLVAILTQKLTMVLQGHVGLLALSMHLEDMRMKTCEPEISLDAFSVESLLKLIIRVCLNTGLILGLHPANERQRYFVTMSLIGCAQA